MLGLRNFKRNNFVRSIKEGKTKHQLRLALVIRGCNQKQKLQRTADYFQLIVKEMYTVRDEEICSEKEELKHYQTSQLIAENRKHGLRILTRDTNNCDQDRT